MLNSMSSSWGRHSAADVPPRSTAADPPPADDEESATPPALFTGHLRQRICTLRPKPCSAARSQARACALQRIITTVSRDAHTQPQGELEFDQLNKRLLLDVVWRDCLMFSRLGAPAAYPPHAIATSTGLSGCYVQVLRTSYSIPWLQRGVMAWAKLNVSLPTAEQTFVALYPKSGQPLSLSLEEMTNSDVVWESRGARVVLPSGCCAAQLRVAHVKFFDAMVVCAWHLLAELSIARIGEVHAARNR